MASTDLTDAEIASWVACRPGNPSTAQGVRMALEIQRHRGTVATPPAAAVPAEDKSMREADIKTLHDFTRFSKLPVESAAIRVLLAGRQLTEETRDLLTAFAAREHCAWPRTQEALRRVLDGAP